MSSGAGLGNNVRPDLDETTEVVAHDARWASLFAADAAEIIAHTGKRLRALEHFGSTAVAGLSAKPVIDILVAFVEWPLCAGDREALQELRYAYLGEAGVAGREYFRRRADHATNLAVVEWGGALWADNIALRDYLRAHPAEAQHYAEEKRRVWAEGARTLLAYSSAKSAHLSELVQRARCWRSGPRSKRS